MSDNNLTNDPNDGSVFGRREVATSAPDAPAAHDTFTPTALVGSLCYSTEWDTNEFAGCEPGAE